MNVAQFAPGMIFTLPDQNITDDDKKRTGKLTHPYIILGIKQRKTGDEGKRYFIQVMGITSLMNKVETDEIPIVMSNNTVGYISTSNIYSYNPDSLDMYNYKGTIVDDEFMSRESFIRFLTDMWCVNNGLATTEEETSILAILDDYKEYFSKINTSVPEFRVIKTEKSKPETNVSVAIAKAEAEAEAAVTVDAAKTVIPIGEARKVDKYPFKIQSWSDDEIIQMINLASQYTYAELSKYMGRYTTESNYMRGMKVVHDVAKERGIGGETADKEKAGEGEVINSNKCIPIKPITKYSDAELMATFKYLDANFKNRDECIRYIKANNEKELTTFIAKLKMEMRRRKIIK